MRFAAIELPLLYGLGVSKDGGENLKIPGRYLESKQRWSISSIGAMESMLTQTIKPDLRLDDKTQME